VNLHYANNILHFSGNVPGAGYQFSLYTTAGSNPWSISGNHNWFDNFVINTCPTPGGQCLLTNSTTASTPPFNNIKAMDLRPATGNHPFGLADLLQPLKPPYVQYPAGTSNLTALSSFADVGALQYVANLVSSPCDVNQDGTINVVDVQLEINAALGMTACAQVYDIDKDGLCNIVDVQRVIAAALGGPCVSP
jgi:hypothetical protein